MKNHKNLFIVLATCLIVAFTTLQSVVLADSWSRYYYSNRVETSINSNGQTVYRVYNSNSYTPILEIFARGNNIWNETTQTLLTDHNKGVSYVGIDSDLTVYGVTYANMASKYEKNFVSGSMPLILTDYPEVQSFQKDSNGFTIGIYTGSGLYNIAQDKIVTNYNNISISHSSDYDNYRYESNYSYSSSYPAVVQSGDNYYYYKSKNNYYTYVLSGTRLKYKGSTIATDVEEIAFAKDYLLYVTSDNDAYKIKVGTDNAKRICDDFKEWNYSSSKSYWVVSAEDTDSRTYRIGSNDYDDDYYYDYDDDDDYPYIEVDGTYYYYHKNSSKTYEYRLTDSGKLTYDGVTIATGVDEIQFAEGYMLYVKNDDAYSVKLGSTSYYKKYSDFEDWNFDGDFVESIETEKGTYYLK